MVIPEGVLSRERTWGIESHQKGRVLLAQKPGAGTWMRAWDLGLVDSGARRLESRKL